MHSTHNRFHKHTRQYRLASILLVIFVNLLMTGAVWHFINKPGPKPAAAANYDVSVGNNESLLSTNANTTFAPFLHIVPSEDGAELFIHAGGMNDIGGEVFVNVGEGPTHNKGSYTMTYSETAQAYVAVATGFTPKLGASSQINLTTTLGLDTGAVDFNRAYLPADLDCPISPACTINSDEGNLQLTVLNADTFPSEAYVVVVPSFSPPGPLPVGHHLIRSSYSVRASGALLASSSPMSLVFTYDETVLAGADPHTLAIFAWDAFNQRWDNLGGTLFSTHQQMSVATSRFTTYALMSMPAWRDEFDDLSGMDSAQFDNVTSGGNHTLHLTSTPGNGSAVSLPITPTSAFESWKDLVFSHTANPPTTTLTVDVLSQEGIVVMTDVTNGASLATINPLQYTSLRLRVNLTSTIAGETAALDKWQLGWETDEHEVYLPVMVK